MSGTELTVIWAGIIAFAVVVYVIMDGFDLGIGILFPNLVLPQGRSSRPLPRASRLAHCFRESRSKAAPMPAAGGNG